jgi:hypothetical protein
VISLDTFLEKVENGYELGIYDYHNDQAKREIFSRVLAGAQGDLREKLGAYISEWDRRFITATFVPSKSVFPGAQRRHPDSWWYARLPEKLVAWLHRDALKEGLIGE